MSTLALKIKNNVWVQRIAKVGVAYLLLELIVAVAVVLFVTNV